MTLPTSDMTPAEVVSHTTPVIRHLVISYYSIVIHEVTFVMVSTDILFHAC